MTVPAIKPQQQISPGSLGEALVARSGALVTAYYLVIIAAGLLTMIGTVMVASSYVFYGLTDPDLYSPGMKNLIQVGFVLGGVGLAWLFSRMIGWFKPNRWAVMVYLLLAACCAAQVVAASKGDCKGGNCNWLSISGKIGVQPSEFLKLAMALWLGVVLAAKARQLASWKELMIPGLLGIGLVVGAVLLGSDTGTAAVLGLEALGALIIAGVPWRRILVVASGMMTAGVLAVLAKKTLRDRIAVLFNIDVGDDKGEGVRWQVDQALYSLADGHLTGSGLGNSHEKWGYLTQSDSDFIFAVIGDEFGLLGTLIVLLLVALLAFGLFQLVRLHPTRHAQVAIGAIGCWLVGQALINMAMVLKLLPVIGVPLPFVSSGGSALVAGWLALGAIAGLIRQDEQVGPPWRARRKLLRRSAGLFSTTRPPAGVTGTAYRIGKAARP
ncbi:MAG: FtsW/RodA/SpoVE family cell cycle protein [Bifidobacteriaceae bacterium]|jgi:cell division protein FtsW|nr:FtsW/RodA/SpoVE family cell cycle protein [Bifidobacteriaceae bacterium]